MSYQVLARKWRPRSFKELVGQAHVLQALVNALDQDRLHHAYLFTGTRGVGKTTIARIFAKCLNCEAGVSSTPCGECSACREIDDGRFVDLIEVDAASRTKVEDTRELLDNVQYAPTRGRYKVYLIDEVHMLSAHSFNALLKTLEEPPPHVKFLLATTDPQKLPVTILSRCLQFSLKNMSPERIVGHLEHVLEQEQLPFEVAALWQLARSADGSMRDALSLTDQAIAFGNGQVTESEVGVMLGTIDQGQVMKIVRALASGNAADVLGSVAGLADYSPDYMAVLDDLLAVLHRVAIGQAVPDAVDNSQGDRDQVIELAAAMTAEDVQLYYQTGLIGKKDLPLSPEPRSGFEMALLRMLAFRPDAAAASAHVLQGGGSVADGFTVQDDGDSVQDPEPEPEPGGAPSPVAASVAASVVASVVESEPVSSDGVHPVGGSADEPPGAAEDSGSILPVESSLQPLPASSESEEGGQSERAVDAFEPPLMGEPELGSPPDHSVEPLSPHVEAIPLEAYEQVLSNEAPAGEAGFQDEEGRAPPAEAVFEGGVPAVLSQPVSAPVVVEASPVRAVSSLPDKSDRIVLGMLDAVTWIAVYWGLPMGGVTGTIGSHCEFLGCGGGQVKLRLDERRSTLYNETHRQRIEKALSDYFEHPLRVSVETGSIVSETPAAWRERKIAKRLQEARDSIFSDDRIKGLVEVFSASVLEDSIQPVGNTIK